MRPIPDALLHVLSTLLCSLLVSVITLTDACGALLCVVHVDRNTTFWRDSPCSFSTLTDLLVSTEVFTLGWVIVGSVMPFPSTPLPCTLKMSSRVTGWDEKARNSCTRKTRKRLKSSKMEVRSTIDSTWGGREKWTREREREEKGRKVEGNGEEEELLWVSLLHYILFHSNCPLFRGLSSHLSQLAKMVGYSSVTAVHAQTVQASTIWNQVWKKG